MSTVRINNEIDLTYPDSYQEMGEEELKRYFSTAENRWGAYDAERHVILSVCWKKAGFFSFLTDPESVMVGAEARMKRRLINYRRKEASRIKIASKKKNGYGIRFEYRVNGANIYQVSDLRIFKYKGKFYSFQYIGRRINDEECHPDFDAFMDSITLAK